MSDRTYTLDEAQRLLGERECERRGHDYELILDMTANAPRHVQCNRCGRSWGTVEYWSTSAAEPEPAPAPPPNLAIPEPRTPPCFAFAWRTLKSLFARNDA